MLGPAVSAEPACHSGTIRWALPSCLVPRFCFISQNFPLISDWSLKTHTLTSAVPSDLRWVTATDRPNPRISPPRFKNGFPIKIGLFSYSSSRWLRIEGTVVLTPPHDSQRRSLEFLPGPRHLRGTGLATDNSVTSLCFPACEMGQQQCFPGPREALQSSQPGNAILVGTRSRSLVGAHLPRAGGGEVLAEIKQCDNMIKDCRSGHRYEGWFCKPDNLSARCICMNYPSVFLRRSA